MHVHYRPAEHVLDRLMRVDFVAVVGPTAAGKSSVISEAAQKWSKLHLVRSTTSRAPRPGEQDGVDCHFQAKPSMEERIKSGEYATVVLGAFGGDIYATDPEDYETSGVAVLPVLASAIPMFKALPFKRFRCVFVSPPSYQEWMRRLERHDFPAQKRAARLAEAAQSLQFALSSRNIPCIVNGSLNSSAQDFTDFVRQGTLVSNQSDARATIDDIARQLKDVKV